MKASECLKKAKPLIASSNIRWICIACSSVDSWGATSHRIDKQIQADIDVQLNFSFKGTGSTYSCWLIEVHKLYLTDKQLIEARLQYMDALINYYQQQGD